MKHLHPNEAQLANGFFFESWLLKELDQQEYPSFVSGLHLKESRTAYHLSIAIADVNKEDCDIYIELPYLYIRVQHQEYRDQLSGLFYAPSTLRIYARHFLLPEDVDADRVLYNVRTNYLSIYLPKYSAR
jgi:HSP20 family molecular chaperone IbpA